MPFTLKDIAQSLGGKIIGDDRVTITGIKPLDEAAAGDISFYYDQRYRESVKKTNASALLVSNATDLYRGPQVVVSNPVLAYARVAGMFALPLSGFSGISPKAMIHEDCSIGQNVTIFPMVYAGEGVLIGDRVMLFPGVYIGDRVRIGEGTVIHPNVTIMHDCIIGREVIIHAGTVIGSDGFGFARDGSASVKIPQIGTVQIDDHVEIGANNTIDRSALGKTWIQRGVKTDNMVHIAHNVTIGEDTIIVAQTGIAGSSYVGKGVVIGGQVGINDHIRIEDGVMIGSQSGVRKSIEKGEAVSGTPAMPHKLWLKTTRLIPRLPSLFDRLRNLEKDVDRLKKE